MGLLKNLIGFSSSKRQPASGFQSQSKKPPSQETFILESILTPSGLVDGGDDSPDPIIIESELLDEIESELDSEVETASEEDLTPVEVSNLDEVDEVEIPFITDLEELDVEDNSETSEEDLAESNEEITSEAESSSELTENSDAEITESNSDSDSEINQDLEVDSESSSEVEESSTENITQTVSSSESSSNSSTSEESVATASSSEEMSEDSTLEESPTEEISDELTLHEESETEDTETTAETSVDESIEETESSTDSETEDSNNTDTVNESENETDSNAEIIEEIVNSPIDLNFDSGIFTVGETGEIGIDYLFDGGGFGRGELAIFSLEGMEELDLTLEEFIKEAANRALSDSELGHVVISDGNEGAKFSGGLEETDFNRGEYLGVKTFNMRPGDKFAVMLVPNGKVQQVFDNPSVEGTIRPLFSLSTANPEDGFQLGQIADVTGDGNTFVFEDLRIDNKSDHDYNDIIFQVRGASGEAVHLDEVISQNKDWRSSDMGQALIEYAQPYITPEEPIVEIENNLSDLLTELEDLLDQEESETETESDEEVSNSEVADTEVIDETVEFSEDEESQNESTELVESTESEIEESEIIEIEENSETSDSSTTEVIEIEDNLETSIGESTEPESEQIEVEESLQSSIIEETEESGVTEIEENLETPVVEESLSELEETEVEENLPTAVVEETEKSELVEIEDSGNTPIVQQTEESEVTEIENNLETSIVEETEESFVIETEENSESSTSQTELIVIEDSSENLTVEETDESEVVEIADNFETSVVGETEELEVVEIVDNSETSVVEENLSTPIVEEAEESVVIEAEENSESSTSQTEPTVIEENLENSTVVGEAEESEVVEIVDNSETSVVEEVENNLEITLAEESEQELEETELPEISETSFVQAIEQLENVEIEKNLDNSGVEETEETELIDGDNSSESSVLPVDTTEFEDVENILSGTPPTPTVESPTVNLVNRLEKLTYNLQNQTLSQTPVNSNLIQQLEQLTNRLITQAETNPNFAVSANTLQLIERLETQLITKPVLPTPVEPPVQFEFATEKQPLVGIIDTGFSGDNPDIDYTRITWGSDKVDGDTDPTLAAGEGNEHGTHVLGIIAAQQNNGIGIDGINDNAPIWAGRAIGSGKWAESLVEFVDAAKASGQPNAVVNLSLDLTQIDAEGNVTTRYEFTPQERAAIEYARQNGVLIVAASGNDGGVMSVLGQASQEFDNIITVGAAQRINDQIALSKAYDRADYSSYGRGLDIMADGGTVENPVLSTTGNGVGTMAGTSVATAKVTGAISQVWAANPELSYRQVIEILKQTATDLGVTGFDQETGAGLLNIAAAVQLAKVTTPEVYNPTPWVTPDTWSGEGKVTPEERAAQGGTSLATATVQTSPNFSELDRVDSNQPDKYYQFTVNEPGYVKWNLTSLNPVSGFPTPPNVTIIKADGKPGSHIFSKGIGISLSSSVIGEGQTSFSGGDFYDPGTYYLKVGNGAGATFKDYNISTQFTPDQVSSFAGNIQYRTQPYYSLDDSLQSPIFSGPAVSELKNLAGVVTYDEINFNNRIAKYGFEVKESGKFRINLNSPNGKMELSVKKFIGSEDRPVQLSGLGVAANSDGWLEVELNKGRYDIEVKTPSNYWQEPDWTWAQQTLVRPYTLNATFTPNAPQPGQGKVPSSAGIFDKTVVSNGVVNHYYKNGYLTVQPSGQASWYGYPMIVISGSAERINEPVPLTDPDGNYSIQTAANLFGAVGGADLGNGVNTDQVGIGRVVSSIGGKDLSDFYKFSLNGSKLVSFKLSDLDNGANFELIQDLNGNGQIDRGEVIATRMTNRSELWLDRILGAGNYYLRVSPGSSGATTQYVVNAEARFPENQVIAGYNSDYYLVQNAQLRWIPNQETLNALKINPNTVKRFSNEDLARIPSGNLLPSQKDGDVFADFAGNIYLMQSGKRSLLPKGYTPKDIGINVTGWPTFPESDLTNIPLGQPINRPAQLILNTTITPINETPPPSSVTLNPSNGDLNFTRGQQWVTSGGYKFVFQPDGNLVMYNPQGKETWATGTYNTNATRFAVQHDGNVVLYDDHGKALWATNTWGNLGAYFKIQGDGNLVVYDSNNQPLFNTKTYDGKTGTFTASADWLNQQAPQQNLNNRVGYDGANTHPTYVNTFNRNGGSSALGSATGNVYRSVDNGYLQEFSGGSEGSGAIMKSGANDNSYWVGGSFWAQYLQTGGVTGVLGYPTSDRYEFNGGWKQNFQNGTALSTTLPLTPVSNSGTNTSPQAPQILSQFTESGTGKLINLTNFRSYPWADPNNSNLIQAISAGTTFTLLENVTTNDSTYPNWYKVRLNNGDVGYFWANNVEKLTSSSGGINQTPINNNQLGLIGVVNGNITPIDDSNNNTPVFPYISITTAYDANDGDNFVVAGSKIILSGKTNNAQKIQFYLGDIPLTQGNINSDNNDDNFSATLIIPPGVAPGSYQIKAVVNSPTGDATSSGLLINVQETKKPLLVASNSPSIPGETIDFGDNSDNVSPRISNTHIEMALGVRIADGPKVGGKYLAQFPILLTREDGKPIEANKTTWIVSHGMNNTPKGGPVEELWKQIDSFDEGGDQVLTLDWSALARGADLDNNGKYDDSDPGIGGSNIEAVAKAVKKSLEKLGFSDYNYINLAGHSLGALLSYEISEQLGTVNKLIALDTAASTLGMYNDDVNFSRFSNFSWGFYGSLAGHQDFTKTADESFRFEFENFFDPRSNHGNVVSAFSRMLQLNKEKSAGNVSNLFNLNNMSFSTPKLWTRHDGYEAILKPKEDLSPNFLEYYKGGQWDSVWNWPDVWES
ncbi:S8 family serine peptidase [Limnoraphis robusta Tam1]|uniref:S8 family serine peptidase n=1 Tax=Limnoraphis robusta TaxID=1118279 RepID=UPI002B20A8F3|nr:S8 family serine peptidase [Limnoraphis robusta]MEA5543295.1 S8 family serine peptidase [Limnoraphis robusta Tam1]